MSMDHGVPEIRREGESSSFPSPQLITGLYSVGALLGLICAFLPSLEALQTTNCLLISWVLALGAFATTVFADSADDDEPESFDV